MPQGQPVANNLNPPCVLHGHIEVHVGQPHVSGHTCASLATHPGEGSLKGGMAREARTPAAAHAVRWSPSTSSGLRPELRSARCLRVFEHSPTALLQRQSVQELARRGTHSIRRGQRVSGIGYHKVSSREGYRTYAQSLHTSQESPFTFRGPGVQARLGFILGVRVPAHPSAAMRLDSACVGSVAHVQIKTCVVRTRPGAR